MKTPKQCRIEAAASSDPSRPILAYVQRAPGALVASDGVILAHVPATDDPADAPGLIHAKALSLARKATPKRSDLVSLAVNADNYVLPDGTTHPRPPEGMTYPRWEMVVPKAERYEGGFSVRIDPKKLLQLADAVGGGSIVLTFCKDLPERSPIRVVSPHSPGAWGIIMPTSLP